MAQFAIKCKSMYNLTSYTVYNMGIFDASQSTYMLDTILGWLVKSQFFSVAGNGYIEGKELENFFRELEISRKGAGVVREWSLDLD